MRHDVVIIGLGAMGAAAAAHLARRGISVLGIDRFGIPNHMGSSHGDTRVIRLCYYEHADYVPLLRRAFQLWADLDQAHPEPITHLTGGLYIGPTQGDFITGSLRAATAHDLPHELLDAQALAERFPQFTLRDGHTAVYEPNAGFVMCERAITAHADRALRAGAVLHSHERVMSITSRANHVIVRTERDTYHAEQVIVTAGAWSASILPDASLPLSVTRQTLGWVWPHRPELFAIGTLPVWGVDDPDGHFHYGFPMIPSRCGAKIARHYVGPVCDADTLPRIATTDDADELRAVIRNTVPDADGPILSMGVCMYTNTPDGHFIIDRHPLHERIIIAAGFSGHGFKFAPVIGEILADLAIDGSTRHPIDFLKLGRFSC